MCEVGGGGLEGAFAPSRRCKLCHVPRLRAVHPAETSLRRGRVQESHRTKPRRRPSAPLRGRQARGCASADLVHFSPYRQRASASHETLASGAWSASGREGIGKSTRLTPCSVAFVDETAGRWAGPFGIVPDISATTIEVKSSLAFAE